MLCRVDGFRVWTDALPLGVSSGCFAAIVIYDFTSLLASKVLSSFTFGSISGVVRWRAASLMVLAFRLCWGLRW